MNGPGLYMISGVESLTGNTFLDFYRENKILCWSAAAGLALLIGSQIKKPKKQRKK